MVLLGPTASGKTPLGDFLEEHGLWGRRCAHFDFGARLRHAAAGDDGLAFLSCDDLVVIRDVLGRGALLEDDQFSIAQKILRQFLSERQVDEQTLVVLNGLPRHSGQARALADLVDVKAVVVLDCMPEVVVRRIAMNTGGDRLQRTDDCLEAVRHRLDIYHARTAPLVDYYRRLGIAVMDVVVGLHTQPGDVAAEIASHQP
jgi:adenylate kinase family enzyme